MRTVYAGLNDCHFTEKLREVEGLTLCRESVRRIRQSLALPAKHPRRRPAIGAAGCPRPGWAVWCCWTAVRPPGSKAGAPP